jgi:hypothetical protein
MRYAADAAFIDYFFDCHDEPPLPADAAASMPDADAMPPLSLAFSSRLFSLFFAFHCDDARLPMPFRCRFFRRH